MACEVGRLHGTISFWSIAPAFGYAGPNEPGTKHAHSDAERCYLFNQPLGYVDDCEFARRVRAEAETTIQPRHRGSVDDVASFAVGADMWQEGPDPMHDPHEIDIEHPPPGV